MSSFPSDLHLTADLVLEADGATARITGDGSQVTVAVDDAAALASRMRAAAATLPGGLGGRRRALASSVRALDAAGLTVTLTDGKGALVTAGRGVHSRLARFVVADPHVRVVRRREAAGFLAGLALPKRRR